MSDPKDEKMVVAAQFIDIRQAELALSVLEGHHIDAFLDVPYAASIVPQYMFGSSGVSLFVRESDLEDAKELLSAAGEIEDE